LFHIKNVKALDGLGSLAVATRAGCVGAEEAKFMNMEIKMEKPTLSHEYEKHNFNKL
jgi:hypothetical protein